MDILRFWVNFPARHPPLKNSLQHIAQSLGELSSAFVFVSDFSSFSLSKRFCTTSQLYTRAIATSMVCVAHVRSISPHSK